MCRALPSILAAVLLVAPVPSPAQEIPSPEDFLGRRVGEDRYLAPYPAVLDYLRTLDAASERLSIELAGKSTLDNDVVVLVLTSEENQLNLDRYREIARRLAHPEGLGAEEARRLADEGKAIVLVTCTIHSTEVGSTQMVMEFAHQVATSDDPELAGWLDDVILLVVPSINPDGQIMVVDWYDEYLGTEYEGGRMPWLYHHYVGHDDNRDFYQLTQKESRIVNDILYHRWFPQVFLDEHQMGSTGPRMFVPPHADPVAPEVHSLVFRQVDLLGTAMSLRLEEAGKLGVGHDMIYDSYWPGGTRNTAWWKNVTGLLTEVASARIATPIYVDPGELQGGRKGLPEYDRRSNFPSPWPGGWWRLRDIVDYELIATRSLLESSSRYRRELLVNFYRMAREAIERGKSEPPNAFVVPPGQHDPVAAARLVELLILHGVEVRRAEAAFTSGLTAFPAGSYVIPAAQPYRAFLLTMLRPQRYPEVVPYEGGPIYPPYDVTSWSLPVAMGVEIHEAERPLTAELQPIDAPVPPETGPAESAGGHLIAHSADSAVIALNRFLAAKKEVYWLGAPTAGGTAGDIYLPPGSLAPEELERLATELHLAVRGLETRPRGKAFRVERTRVGLYKPWVASMDEGWTRYLLERYEVPFVNLSNEDMRSGRFRDQIDVLLLPDVDKSTIAKGRPEGGRSGRVWTPMPPPYGGGIEKGDGEDEKYEGGKHLKEWIESGGTAVALDSSSAYLIELLELPVTDVLDEASSERFNCPGSMLRILVDTGHPLGFGLRPEEAAYFASSPAFRTRLPDARFERRVVARYPDDEKDILVSGYLKGGELIEKRAAVVELEVGEGKVVLIGFRPQHRAQPYRTFKLLFNALFLPGLSETDL